MGKLKLAFMSLVLLIIAAGCQPSAPSTVTPPITTTPPASSTNPPVTQTAPPVVTTTVPPTSPTTTTPSVIVEGLNIGNRAPDFDLPTLMGGNISLSSLRGKPVLLNLWATWCPPCKIELPFLQQINDTWSEKGLVVIEVDLLGTTPTETPTNLANFMQSNNYTFTAPMDIEKKVTKSYAITVVPDTYFIDKDGIIRGKQIGNFSTIPAIEADLASSIP